MKKIILPLSATYLSAVLYLCSCGPAMSEAEPTTQPDTLQPTVTQHDYDTELQYVRSSWSTTNFSVHKIKVDSIYYIVVSGERSISIIKHK